ncbi:hypothetical protein FJT64_026618 [Amphibalanus amphitrite]|uniref:C-type lectin domain-containing protein n=1 Tax=Amphibalanus amphitrite TaxID=1232801 RepID=A0A6A4WB01_AMPAM|nr:hypothetical protein FJT64_026618 [Amphibalanus amphitrite]
MALPRSAAAARVALVASLLAVVCPQLPTDQPFTCRAEGGHLVCRDNGTRVEFRSETVTWREAHALCRRRGAFLVPSRRAFNSVILDRLYQRAAAHGDFWLGARYLRNGYYEWLLQMSGDSIVKDHFILGKTQYVSRWWLGNFTITRQMFPQPESSALGVGTYWCQRCFEMSSVLDSKYVKHARCCPAEQTESPVPLSWPETCGETVTPAELCVDSAGRPCSSGAAAAAHSRASSGQPVQFSGSRCASVSNVTTNLHLLSQVTVTDRKLGDYDW